MEKSTRICLLTEDTYAPQFLERIINRLIKEGLINRPINVVKKEHTYGKYNPCNPKLGRIVKAIIDGCDKVLIFIDADRHDANEVRQNKVVNHLRGTDMSKVHIVVFRYEIEEWVEYSLYGQLSNKPSNKLKSTLDYGKSQLPNYADKLDFRRLMNVPSFKDFLRALTS